MTRSGLIPLCVLAACAISGAVATPALAGGGLPWVVEGKELGAGESVNTTASNVGAFKLKTSVITLVCNKTAATGTIKGGTPGTDTEKFKFTECSVEGHPSCTVNSPSEAAGTIVMEAKTELVYVGSKVEAEKEEGKLGEIFTPVSGETFVEIVVGGSGCPLFTKGEQELKGSMIAEITPVNIEGKVVKLILPASAIKKGYRWLKTGEVTEVASSLKVFGVIEAVFSGEASLELEGGKAFGAYRNSAAITVVSPSESTVNFGKVSGEEAREVIYSTESGSWTTNGYTLTGVEGSTSAFTVTDECSGTYKKGETCKVEVTLKPVSGKYVAKLTLEGGPTITLEGSKK